MKRDPTPLRNLLAMLCVVLAVVFVAASAASVVDGAQHASQSPHEHGLHLTFSEPDDDHHHGRSAHHHQGDGGSAADHQSGPGHHHADAPAGALSLPAEVPLVLARAEVAISAMEAAGPKGVRPGGLERPPRRIAKLV